MGTTSARNTVRDHMSKKHLTVRKRKEPYGLECFLLAEVKKHKTMYGVGSSLSSKVKKRKGV